MSIYLEEVGKIEKMLNGFILNRKIETDQLGIMDKLISFEEREQDEIIDSHYTVSEQSVLFNSVLDVRNILQAMKQRLIEAHAKGENPTTAERALELMPDFYNLVPYMDCLARKGNYINFDRLSDETRILHKKADKLGFEKDMEIQMKEAEIDGKDIEEFLDEVKANVATELDIDITGDVSDENTH